MVDSIIFRLFVSWKNTTGSVNSFDEILDWINERKAHTHVSVKECNILESAFWFYDDYNGEILNRKRGFFSIKGMRMFLDGRFIKEQPVILQPEIGYLGIICKEINGILNFLMQAKIEPGNVNAIQISPTIQATKSNFMRVHGGKLPYYFSYFENASKYKVIYDSIQSEQSTRFYKKQNRNIIIEVNEEIEVENNYCWMTLGQIKKLLRIDNLVNMDTRTVLSGLPFTFIVGEKNEVIREIMNDDALYYSMYQSDNLNDYTELKYYLNNFKMFHDLKVKKIPLNELVDWNVDDNGRVTCRKEANFKVRFYDIEIEGREVYSWNQPLFKASGQAVFGLIYCDFNNKRHFLVSVKTEIGTMDTIEVAPTVQKEAVDQKVENEIDQLFFSKMNKGAVDVDVILSEEGGRFYHEQNRNVIIGIEDYEIKTLPQGYFWVDFSTLAAMMQMNNLLNIQLRNLLFLVDL